MPGSFTTTSGWAVRQYAWNASTDMPGFRLKNETALTISGLVRILRDRRLHPHPGPLPPEGEGDVLILAPPTGEGSVLIPSPPEGERARVRGSVRGQSRAHE